MNKIIRMRHPGCDLWPLASFLPVGLTMVEIGAYAGESMEVYAGSGKVRKIFSVDPWEPGYDPLDPASSCDMALVESEFDRRAAQFQGVVEVVKLKMKSLEAAKLFEDESLDFVYLDGNHRYHAVRSDLKAWVRRVRPGGLIGGHDYANADHLDVMKAVHEIVGQPDWVFPDCSWLSSVPLRKKPGDLGTGASARAMFSTDR